MKQTKNYFKDIESICKKSPDQLTRQELWRLQGNRFYLKAYCLECKKQGWVFDLCLELERSNSVFSTG